MCLQHWKEEQNPLELMVSFLSLSLSFCLHWMEVLCFAACTLLDFSFEGLMSWIIMFWGSWCFLACRRTGNERKFITVYSYQLSFRILINLEAIGSSKHTEKPHCEAGPCIPRAHGRGKRCFNQPGGIQDIILVINLIFLLITSHPPPLCTTDFPFPGPRPRGVFHPFLLISW